MAKRQTLVEKMVQAMEPNNHGKVIGYGSDLAVAVLQAIREPNNYMLAACAKAMSPDRRPVTGRVSVKNKHRIRYRAMIDALIEEAQGRPRTARLRGMRRCRRGWGTGWGLDG